VTEIESPLTVISITLSEPGCPEPEHLAAAYRVLVELQKAGYRVMPANPFDSCRERLALADEQEAWEMDAAPGVFDMDSRSIAEEE